MNADGAALWEPKGTPVYLELLRRIRGGDVKPGHKLVDTKLAVELNVSRMPVREALLRLVHEGYLVGSTRGFMLPQLTAADVANIFQVRRLLEPWAAGAAAHSMDEFGLAALETAHARAKRAISSHDAAGFMDANTRFRQTWLRAAPNDRLVGTIERFVDHVQMIRMATLYDEQSQQVAMKLLDELIVGFRNRDAFYVHEAMIRFIDHARERFFALLPQAQGISAAVGQ